MKLSIIIPVYNEEKTLQKIVQRVVAVDLGKIDKEIIIVDDASTDKTLEIIKELKLKNKDIKVYSHEKNKGKGAAIRTALKYITGDIFVIQDGDLEYNPENFKRLIHPILEKKFKVVYGSRMLGKRTGFVFYSYYFGNKLLSLLTKILYFQNITDMETCYKVISIDVLKKIFPLESNSFDIEPEITAKIIMAGYKILELPINYHCRSFEEGKKIRWKDGVVAIYKLIKYRFIR